MKGVQIHAVGGVYHLGQGDAVVDKCGNVPFVDDHVAQHCEQSEKGCKGQGGKAGLFVHGYDDERRCQVHLHVGDQLMRRRVALKP